MDAIRNVFGNLSNGVIRLLVTVGILAATYVFIVRPTLDTTNHAIDSASNSFHQFDNPSDINTAIEHQIRQSNQQVQQAVNQAQHQLNQQNGNNALRKQQKLLHCIQVANGNVPRIQHCAKRFQ